MKKILTLVVAALCCAPMFATQGALNGRFTINEDGDQIVFSQGNLQYVGTWQFAPHQWSIIGPSQINNYRDLFGWGTGNNPNKVSIDFTSYSTFTDWGANAISNGGDEAGVWRTLTTEEWMYLFRSRTSATTLFGFGSVNGVNGLIILPDNWETPAGASFNAGTSQGLVWTDDNYYYEENSDHYADNTYTVDEWEILEARGAVFLPAGGERNGADPHDVGTHGFYWSASSGGTNYAYCVSFLSSKFYPYVKYYRDYGMSVRLVQTAPSGTTALDDVTSDTKAVKRIVDGQLLIEKNGKTYNVLGDRVQ